MERTPATGSNVVPTLHAPEDFADERLQPADAFVFFGASGDLAQKKIFPALYRLVQRGRLDMPVVGVASASRDLTGFCELARDSVRDAISDVDQRVLDELLGRLRYCGGDYRDKETFKYLSHELQSARHPAHYLAIPPTFFPVVLRGLKEVGLNDGARVIVEKPFGRDLASARDLNRLLCSEFPENSVFLIDHYLGKEEIMNLLYFRFANSFLEPIWNRNYIASIQVTLAESFGVQGRGAFYDDTGCLRDVVENHLFQIVSLLAMEPPSYRGTAAVQSQKLNVFRAMRPLTPNDVVRGQFEGYRDEPGVAPDSDVETFCAVRLHIDSWRWSGVPWFLRSGKRLAETATEVLVQLKPPPQALFGDSEPTDGLANYLRFRLSPNPMIAIAARVKRAGEEFLGRQRELALFRGETTSEDPYERLLGDALAGLGALYTRQEAVEAAWSVVDPVLREHPRAIPYAPGSWGPSEADELIAPWRWHNDLPLAASPAF